MTRSHLIGEVTLRTAKRVFLEGDQYRVESQDRRGNKHGSYLPVAAVSAAMKAWEGKQLNAEEASRLAEPVADPWNLPYTYGHKLRYCVQDLLVVLAAEGIAEVVPAGRGFQYAIGGGKLSKMPAAAPARLGGTTITELAAAGENQRTEFKSSMVFDHKQNSSSKERALDILRTIAGFLNTEGGTLLVGVKDSGEICGLSADYKAGGSTGDPDRWVLHLRTQIQNAMGHNHWKCISCEIVAANGLDVAQIRIEPAGEPAFVKWRGEQMYFIRTLNATQKLDLEAAMAHIRSRFG